MLVAEVQPNPLMVAPFVALLAAIALAPVFFANWWGRHYGKVALGLGAITLLYYTRGLHAQARTLHGWVRNLGDGRVEAWAEGEAEAVERFERQIRQGPPGARVDDVQVDDAAPTRHETGFSIR